MAENCKVRHNNNYYRDNNETFDVRRKVHRMLNKRRVVAESENIYTESEEVSPRLCK